VAHPRPVLRDRATARGYELQPHIPYGGVLTIGVISDTTVPFHVHLGNVHDLVTAAGLMHARMVPAHLPLFFDTRADVTSADVVALCSAV
jgi:hypothetical protein